MLPCKICSVHAQDALVGKQHSVCLPYIWYSVSHLCFQDFMTYLCVNAVQQARASFSCEMIHAKCDPYDAADIWLAYVSLPVVLLHVTIVHPGHT